jgi:hypothetical protein
VLGNPVSLIDPTAEATISLPSPLAAPGWAAPVAGGIAVAAVGAGSWWVGSRFYERHGTGLLDLLCRDDGSECAKEWEEAYRICRKLINDRTDRENWRKVGKRPPTIASCAKGWVSERCGGNSL